MLEHSRKVTKVVVAVLARARRTRHAITVGDKAISRKIARNLVEEHTGRILVPRPNPNRKGRAKVGKVKPETKKTANAVEDDDEEEYHDEEEQEQPENEEGLGAFFVCVL